MLLEPNDVNTDAADKSGRTSLSQAAICGLGEIVKILLEGNVNPGTADKSGGTPVS